MPPRWCGIPCAHLRLRRECEPLPRLPTHEVWRISIRKEWIFITKSVMWDSVYRSQDALLLLFVVWCFAVCVSIMYRHIADISTTRAAVCGYWDLLNTRLTIHKSYHFKFLIQQHTPLPHPSRCTAQAGHLPAACGSSPHPCTVLPSLLLQESPSSSVPAARPSRQAAYEYHACRGVRWVFVGLICIMCRSALLYVTHWVLCWLCIKAQSVLLPVFSASLLCCHVLSCPVLPALLP